MAFSTNHGAAEVRSPNPVRNPAYAVSLAFPVVGHVEIKPCWPCPGCDPARFTP